MSISLLARYLPLFKDTHTLKVKKKICSPCTCEQKRENIAALISEKDILLKKVQSSKHYCTIING